MRSILRHIWPQRKTAALIFVFLLLQAVCDLALPFYTASLIDVGIGRSGIAYAVPEQIRAQTYFAAEGHMEQAEKTLWQASYAAQGDRYILQRDADPAALDAVFALPLAQTAMAQRGTEISREDLTRMGDGMLYSLATGLIKTEYEQIGVDLQARQTAYLLRTGGKMLIMALLMAAAAVLSSLFAARAGAAVGHDLRARVFDRVMHFSGAELSRFSVASLITRTTGDIQQIQLVTTMMLRMVAYAPLMGLGAIFMVLRTRSGMEWIIAVAVCLLLVLVGMLMVIAMPRFKRMQTLVDRVNLVGREILTGLPVIRAFGREETEQKRFDAANLDLTAAMRFTSRTMSLMMPLMMLLMNGIAVLIVWVASGRIDAGVLGVGDMTAFISYTMMIVMSFLMLSMMSFMLPRAAVSSVRIDEVLGADSAITSPEKPQKLSAPKGVLRFEQVSFRYPGAADNVLTDIDFTAYPGQTTAIIGSTGSGKSTLMQLILRFYDVSGGRITIDGMDIRAMALDDLRSLIGFAPQKGVLFSGTIATNIAFGAPEKSREALHEAADIAQASAFIAERPDKLDSPIAQGGTNVSGGQKQRLSIARAIVRDPVICLFDDTFSALDFKTDAALRRALGPKMRESTVLLVAQRISTILHADQILVLDDEGRLAGKGTHKQLLASCETYRQIAGSQLSEEELYGEGEK